MPEPLLDPEIMRRLEQLTMVSRKISTGRLKGERRSRRRGSSNDFADFRNYVPGDDLRFLDWKIYGRLERLFLKLFLEEEDLRVYILIDSSPSMAFGDPEKFLFAKRVAAALGYICLTQMDSLTVSAFSDGVTSTFGPKRGKVNGARYFDFLDKLEVGGETDLFSTFKTFAQAQRTKGIAIVISDFYDFGGYEDAFRQLFARDFEVLAIQVLSPEELKPTVQGDVRLVDAEVDLTTDVSMGAGISALYEKTLNTFCNGIKDHLIGHGGYYMLTSTETPFERLVLDILRRKGVVR